MHIRAVPCYSSLQELLSHTTVYASEYQAGGTWRCYSAAYHAVPACANVLAVARVLISFTLSQESIMLHMGMEFRVVRLP
jgi:hypothetical protein